MAIYNEDQDPNILALDTTKSNVISEIKEIIENYGNFNTAEVEASYSPTVQGQKGNLSHLIESFEKDRVEVEVYGNSESGLDFYHLTYEELDIETLEYILELAQAYQEQQEEEL